MLETWCFSSKLGLSAPYPGSWRERSAGQFLMPCMHVKHHLQKVHERPRRDPQHSLMMCKCRSQIR